MGMLGAALVYVGFVLFMNGLKTLGKLKASHVIPMNLFTGTLIVAGAIRIVLFHGEAHPISMLCSLSCSGSPIYG
jgi:hypothetical protein